MIRSWITKLAVALGVWLVLGFAPGGPTFNDSTAEAALTPPSAQDSCATVTTSVYAAVYSHTSGFTTCYETASFVIPEDGGALYELTIEERAESVPEGARVWVDQGGNVKKVNIYGRTAQIQLDRAQGNTLNISILPSGMEGSLILAKPVNSFVFDMQQFDQNQGGHYLTDGMVAGLYDIFIHKPRWEYADIWLADRMGNKLKGSGGQDQDGWLEYPGHYVFSHVPISASAPIYALVRGSGESGESEYEYEDAFYIGALPEQMGLIKARLYDSESEESTIQIVKLDGTLKSEVSGMVDFPAPNLMFIRKPLQYIVEWYAFPDWEHQVQVSVDGVPSLYGSHTITINGDPFSDESPFATRDIDIGGLWNVQLTGSGTEGIPLNVPGLRVYAWGDYEDFPQFGYTEANGKVTFLNYDPEMSYKVKTALKYPGSLGHPPRYVQTGPLAADNTLPVTLLKLSTAPAAEPVGLQDIVRLVLQPGISTYDIDQDEQPEDVKDDVRYLLRLLLPYAGPE